MSENFAEYYFSSLREHPSSYESGRPCVSCYRRFGDIFETRFGIFRYIKHEGWFQQSFQDAVASFYKFIQIATTQYDKYVAYAREKFFEF